MEDGNRQQRQKKCKIIFFKKHYIFLLILHINEEQEIPGWQKVVRGQMHVSLNPRSCTILHSALRLRLSASARLGYIYSGNEGVSLSYHEREARVINKEREIARRQKIVCGSNVQVLTSHAGLNPRSESGYEREARVIKNLWYDIYT